MVCSKQQGLAITSSEIEQRAQLIITPTRAAAPLPPPHRRRRQSLRAAVLGAVDQPRQVNVSPERMTLNNATGVLWRRPARPAPHIARSPQSGTAWAAGSLGCRVWPLVCGCPFLWMNGSATGRSRHPWHIRPTCCAAARPSLPAAMAMAMPYGSDGDAQGGARSHPAHRC